MGWQWQQQDHMQITCTWLQTDNHTSTSPVCHINCAKSMEDKPWGKLAASSHAVSVTGGSSSASNCKCVQGSKTDGTNSSCRPVPLKHISSESEHKHDFFVMLHQWWILLFCINFIVCHQTTFWMHYLHSVLYITITTNLMSLYTKY